MFKIPIKVHNKKITKSELLTHFIEHASNIHFTQIINALDNFNIEYNDTLKHSNQILLELDKHNQRTQTFLQSSRDTLDSCIYSQENAKRQVMRVLGQWVTGNDTGYCLGFEGPPGTGKTTLAREGIAKILKDVNGVARPFKMIALGGSTNGSNLVGHNYTYLGSSCGDIVRILIDSECMNPIIYIDELDKVS